MYSSEIHSIFAGHIKHAPPPQDSRHLFSPTVSTPFAALTASKNTSISSKVFGGGVGGIKSKPDASVRSPLDSADPWTLIRSTMNSMSDSGSTKDASDQQPRTAGTAGNDVFADALVMLIPVITREQNLIMDLFGMRPSSMIKSDVVEWQEDLAKRAREAIKDQKIQRRIGYICS